MLPVLVFDFDGTVCLGDGPVRAYAEEAVRGLADEVATAVLEGLDRHLDGAADGFADGYGAVAALAAPYVTPDDLQKAYAVSRERLATGALDVAAPAGLAGFLDEVGGHARRVLVTNAPLTGLVETLDALGLTAGFDAVRTDAGKPAGLPPVLAELLAGAPPAQLMSIGDVWVNDIDPALRVGCATAYLPRDAADDRPAHLRARHLPDLYPALAAWVTDPTQLENPT
ncbi:HAD family hydrolase [Pseudonocardia sp. CA-107938]|uniref:HAD family hydrolase n=1 Tax=Pseudonocardia sp. CA-107938 TaxID=3240021 RepID=UPI003D914D92